LATIISSSILRRICQTLVMQKHAAFLSLIGMLRAKHTSSIEPALLNTTDLDRRSTCKPKQNGSASILNGRSTATKRLRFAGKILQSPTSSLLHYPTCLPSAIRGAKASSLSWATKTLSAQWKLRLHYHKLRHLRPRANSRHSSSRCSADPGRLRARSRKLYTTPARFDDAMTLMHYTPCFCFTKADLLATNTLL